MVKGLSELVHTSVDLPRGGEVIVLDTGAVITAEAEAMLQALHSRSVGGLRSHLEILSKKGPDRFMQSFYVGYGHKSIGDCGTTTVFIEGVSMLAAKAIQDSALYCGQEASTRYIDFSTQRFVDPTVTKVGNDLLEKQRKFYLAAQDPTRTKLMELHPQGPKERDTLYQKAIKARGFDITRSLLPAGVSTNLAWHTSLRQAADRMLFLRHHPLTEVREIAASLEEALNKHHLNSFGHKKYEESEAYQDLIAALYLYHDPLSPVRPVVDLSKIDRKELDLYRALFDARPKKTELPKYLAQIGTVDARFQIDFGSFRDIQRHRAIVQRMPLLTAELGFNQWYTDNMPEEVGATLQAHLGEVVRQVEIFGLSPEEAQYFLPMGYNTSNRFTGDLPATVYMVELRDSRFVHPTLQAIAHKIGITLSEELGIPLHVDSTPNRFDVRRGEQDIVLRSEI
jgi:thymidylate synthase ThyX